MNRLLHFVYPAALIAGLLAVAGAAGIALRHHPLAFAVTLLIAGFFGLGAWELWRFRQSSQGLAAALDGLTTPLDAWLARVPERLREAVRQRLEGLRATLPGPVLAPALAGLLVMLGMLGTFAGLALTLGGTASALGATTDLATLRGALSAPLSGLGLAFSTSVAGVATSAMLGLMSLLARRERQAVAERLDEALTGLLRPFTAAYRREQAEQALPAVLTQLAERLASQQAEFLQAWQQEQRSFHAETHSAYRQLAASVDTTLREALTASMTQAGALLQPIAEATMAGIAREATALQGQVAASVSQQLGAVGERFQQGAEGLAQRSQALLEAQLQATAQQLDAARALLADTAAQARESVQTLQAGFEAQLGQAAQQQQQRLDQHATQAQAQLAEHARQSSSAVAVLQAAFATQAQALVESVQQAQRDHQSTLTAAEAERLAAWRHEMQQAGEALRHSAAEAARQQLAQQQQVADALAHTAREVVQQAEAQARVTLGEARALLQSAVEAPRAAAEVVSGLREQLSNSLARDNAALSERAQLLDTLGQLLAGLQQAAGDQREAIDTLVERSSAALDAVSQRFTTQVEARTGELTEAVTQLHTGVSSAATHLAASAAEMASLGEGFGVAVEQFQSVSEGLLGKLGQLDTSLAQMQAHSSEQLSYTVAQARELIDLCLMSQKQVLDRLGRVAEVAHG